MHKIKVTFIESPQNYGGSKIATLDLVERLASIYDTEVMDLYGTCEPFTKECHNKGIRYKVINKSVNSQMIRSSVSFIKNFAKFISVLPNLLRTRRKLYKAILSSKPDYICLTGFRPMYLLLGYTLDVKVVFFAHGWYLNKQLSFFTRFLLKRVDKIVCISEATKQSLYNNSISSLEDLFVMHNAVDEKTLHTNDEILRFKREGNFIIHHSGGFTKGKGQHISVEIARMLKLKGIPFKMVFTGLVYLGEESKMYFEEIKAKVLEYDIANNIIFVVNKSNIDDYMASCDVLIHPSETEGLPLVIMEAMYFSKPVVANAVGGVIDMIHHGYTGFLPNHNNVSDYVRYIEILYRDKEIYSMIANNAKKLINTSFSKQEQLNVLSNVFTNEKG